MSCNPDVAFAAVVGVPDPLYGESGYAFVQVTAPDRFDAEGLKAWCKQELSNYKVPKVFEPIETMPLLPNGKLDKTALKQMARARV